jgi:hypothetical protein
MSFRLANAPAIFQFYVFKIFNDFLNVCMIVYLDDILIYSQSSEKHEKHVCKVLKQLCKFQLYAKLSKCVFEIDTVNFLDFVMSPESISME